MRKIKEHYGFASKIKDEPIELLEAIKTLMHDTVRAVYTMTSIVDELVRLLNMCQQDNKYLLDFVMRFKQNWDILKSQISMGILGTFCESQ